VGQVGGASEHHGLQLLDDGDVTSMLANARREAAYFRGRAGGRPAAPGSLAPLPRAYAKA
jgi:hypothetical protein